MNPRCLPSTRMALTLLTMLGLAAGCASERERATAMPQAPDSVTAATVALDTLRRLGAKEYVVDSLVRRADTAFIWVGPRVWMATDRPTSVVSVMVPGRVVGVRHILGG